MRKLGVLTIVALTLLLQGCDFIRKHPKEDVVAECYGKYLYKSELDAIIPEGTSMIDSIQRAGAFIDTWIRRQVLLHQAENNLGDLDFSKELEEYRNSLVVYTFESQLIDQRLDTIVTDEEMEILRRHTIDGEKIIDRLTMPGQEELHACFKDVARHHHERWDGHGYPDGTVGDAIPFGTQAVGIADVYDALVSPRSYKQGIPADKAIEMIYAGEAGQFNPKLLECFKVCVPQIKQLY